MNGIYGQAMLAPVKKNAERKEGGKTSMRIGKKLVLGMAVGLSVMLLGNPVNASLLPKNRILNPNELSLGANLVTGSSVNVSSVKLSTKEQEMWNTLVAGNTIRFKREDLQSYNNIVCIAEHVNLPQTKYATYSKNGDQKSYSNDAKAYILSNPRTSNAGKEMHEVAIQGAFWGTQSGQMSSEWAGKELYNEALKFAEFRKNYTAPSLINTDPKSKDDMVGPYKVKYYMTYYNTTLFGQIIDATLKDDNGTSYKLGTHFWLVDKNGNAFSNKVGTNSYSYPTSEQEFYIKLADGVKVSKANLSIKFNNLQATAYYLELEGTYAEDGYTDKTFYCPDCKAKINNSNCGDSYNGTKYAGYNLKEVTEQQRCGYTYDVIKNLPSSLGTSPTKIAYCGGGNTVSVAKVMWGSTVKETQSVKCGSSYSYTIYSSDGRTYVMTANVTAPRCNVWSNVTKYTIGECTSLNPCDNCKASLGSGCGKFFYTGYDDKNADKQAAICGKPMTLAPNPERVSQPLIIAYGNRTRLETTLTDIEVNFASIDLSLRKFITAVNDVSITNRIPQVDVSPLNNSVTTSNYNHTKQTVGVKVGDLVTYTIRVYNEGTLDGYAKEIKDYLPSNLEYVTSIVDGVNYNWKVTTANGKTVLTTTYLANTILDKFNGKSLDYADVKVICKVKATAVPNERLVNLAEITKYADNEGTVISEDIDSKPQNMNLPNDNNWPNYNGSGTVGNYVKGQEDDDDFESVTVLLTDIAGTVWLDGVEGKQEERDGVLTSKDKKMSGITVRLYTSTDNYTTPISTTTTDNNGHYTFTKATINGVEQNIPVNANYIISFEYGGQQYIPVTATRLTSGSYSAEKSAGEERDYERSVLNDKFYEIVKGTAKNNSGASTVALNYTRNESKHTSSINRDTAFYNASKIVARTEGGFSGTAPYVGYINLGLIERAQVNLGLMTDVSKVDLNINGHNTTYDYNGRDEGTAINLEAKAADLNRVYNQAIYKSDYNYRIADYNQEGLTVKPNESNELQVYVTYKIKVKNYSSKSAKASQLIAYFAPEYNVVESWYEKGSSKANVSWVSAGELNGYKKVTTNSIKGVNIGANEDLYVYVKVQLAKDANGAVLLGEKYIVVELGGYTTDEGLIDTNSEPGNINISNWDNYVKTYEDDTDRAPGLNLYLTEATRTMTGYVWEDSVSGTDSDGVKIGDGIKNGREQNINGITVQLIEKVTINGQVYEYIWQEVQTGNNKVSYMDRNGKLHENSKEVAVGNGEYKFTDYVPGTYIVRFKYGDTEASISTNGQDYKSTTYKGFGSNTSSAKDNKDRRLAVMNYSIKQTNDVAEVLAGNNKEELIKNAWMYADTVESMTIGIKDENPGHNVNFGLLKRPVSKLVAVKEVNGIKISNKGIVYVDTANGITTGLRQAYGSYFIELDDELINGAQLEVSYKIRVENQGEKDTLYNYFEGEAKYGNNQHEIIKTQAELVYDYPEKIGYDDDSSINPSWTKEGVDLSILSSEAASKISGGAIAVKATEKLNKALKPGESTETIYMTLSKIMAAGGEDDLSYSNKVEIVSRINEVGRRDEESTPGNYVPQSDDQTEPDTGVADVTITDPTGQDRIHYGLWIVAGMLFITGIVLIKKFAIGKKK